MDRCQGFCLLLWNSSLIRRLCFARRRRWSASISQPRPRCRSAGYACVMNASRANMCELSASGPYQLGVEAFGRNARRVSVAITLRAAGSRGVLSTRKSVVVLHLAKLRKRALSVSLRFPLIFFFQSAPFADKKAGGTEVPYSSSFGSRKQTREKGVTEVLNNGCC